jgi:hypothetical protein
MDDRSAFLGVTPNDSGCTVALAFPRFTPGGYRVRLTELRRFDARDDFAGLHSWIDTELRDIRTPLGASPEPALVADISGGVRGQILLETLRRLQRERLPRELRISGIVLTATGETVTSPAGAGFAKLPRPLAAAALVQVASGGRLDLEQKGKLTREFLTQLEASRQKRARDDEEPYDLVDAVSLAAYALHRKAAPVVARMEMGQPRRSA